MIIDTADTTTKKLPGLKAAGCESIIRYFDRLPSKSWKQIFGAEARAIAAAGMKLGIVYEGAGSSASSFSETSGMLDATYARQTAPSVGMPNGSAIYFAVDFDANASQIRSRIIPYFKGVHSAFNAQSDMPTLRVGIYCGGLCAEMVKTVYPDTLVWITCSGGWTGSKAYVNAGKQDLWQNKCEVSFGGMRGVDLNVAKNPDWGCFTPWDTGPHPLPPPPPKPIRHDIVWMQTILQNPEYGYTGRADGDVGPLTIAAMIRYIEDHQLS